MFMGYPCGLFRKRGFGSRKTGDQATHQTGIAWQGGHDARKAKMPRFVGNAAVRHEQGGGVKPPSSGIIEQGVKMAQAFAAGEREGIDARLPQGLQPEARGIGIRRITVVAGYGFHRRATFAQGGGDEFPATVATKDEDAPATNGLQ